MAISGENKRTTICQQQDMKRDVLSGKALKLSTCLPTQNNEFFSFKPEKKHLNWPSKEPKRQPSCTRHGVSTAVSSLIDASRALKEQSPSKVTSRKLAKWGNVRGKRRRVLVFFFSMVGYPEDWVVEVGDDQIRQIFLPIQEVMRPKTIHHLRAMALALPPR